MLEPGGRGAAEAAATPVTFNAIVTSIDETTSEYTISVPTALTLAVEASKVYILRARLTIGRDAGASSVTLGFSGPTGASIEGHYHASGNALTNAIQNRWALFDTMLGLTMNVTGQVEIWARIKTDVTAGNITLLWACGAAANTRRLYAGSAMEMQEATEV